MGAWDEGKGGIRGEILWDVGLRIVCVCVCVCARACACACNNNNNNKRPLTPKSMPPAGDEHAKLKT